MSDPYVVTLALPDDVQARLDAERTRWFPAGRTAVGAHLTLFHAVPGDHPVDEELTAATDRAAFTVRVSEVMSLGRGAAYRVRSEELDAVHRRLQRAWEPVLTAQDRQGLRAHVTVQNKVDKEVARATVERLSSGFAPYDVSALGLDLWRYVGGPWTAVRRYPFA